MLRVGIPSTPSSPWLLPLLLLLLCTTVQGLAVNRTIDDTRGDSVTGQAVQFLPGTVWFTSTTCAGCASVPDASLSADNTWTAALYLASIGSISVTMKFSGTAIYVFFIVPNFAADAGLANEVLCDFFIDGAKVGNFQHQSDGSGGFDYNSLVYQKTGIPNGDHVFVIQTTGTTPAVVIFDRAIYTFADDTDTKPPPPPPPSTTASLPSTTHSDDSSTSIPASSPLVSSASSPSPFLSAPAGSLAPQSLTSLPPFYITAGGPTSSIPAIPSGSSQESESNASHSTTRIAVIAGSVAGGVILCIFVGAAVMLWRSRRRQRWVLLMNTGTVSAVNLLDPKLLPTPPPASLRIHIPRSAFAVASTSSSASVSTPSNASGHSPVTRNSGPLPPDQDAAVHCGKCFPSV